MQKNINIKILNKGDSVLNVFNYGEQVAISIKRKKGCVDVILLDKNKDGIPVIAGTWSICEGDGEIEVSSGSTKISTF